MTRLPRVSGRGRSEALGQSGFLLNNATTQA
jgi:hypothetical protein